MALLSPDPNASKTDSCPHLGIREDSQTCLAYPAQWNLCYRAKPVSTVSLEHQRKLCLSPVYTGCPVFLSERSGPLPKQFRGVRTTRGFKWALLLVVILLVALGLWAAWPYLAGSAFPPMNAIPLTLATEGSPLEIAAPLVSVTPLGLAAVTRTPFPIAFSPPAPGPGSTHTPTLEKNCGYALETRIELGGNVLTLHKVRRGESVEMLATNYETSLGAMQAVNYFLPSPLWAELVIVIPVGGLDGDGVPVLEPYLVPEPGVSITSLAGQFSITPEEFIRANTLDVDCPAISGWVLVPRPARKNH